MLINGKTPAHFAEDWYGVDEIYHSLQRRGWLGSPEDIPRDTYSLVFAEWLTRQYCLAMAKGIYLGMEAAKAAADTQDGKPFNLPAESRDGRPSPASQGDAT